MSDFGDSMDCSPPGSSVHGISQTRILSGLPFPAPGVLPNPGMEPSTLESPALEGGFFTAEPPGKPVLCIVVAQSVSPVWLFAASWTAARQASPSFTISQSLLKLMSVEWIMPSNHLIICRPLLLLPSIFLHVRLVIIRLIVCIRLVKGFPRNYFKESNILCECFLSLKYWLNF